MNNNAIINTRLEELLNVMDARANVNIFKSKENNKQDLLRSTKIYNFLSDGLLMTVYGDYKVVGLSIALGVTSILIKEA